ncbi:hypothetical protein ANRL4_03439 [Anaerolineae bacterium]|nr:hypothetical protein ANRL4_03439 [Anaerolineae bacterium]
MTEPTLKQSAKKTPETWGTSSASFYARLEGESSTFQLVTGEQIVGILMGVDRYDVFIEQSDGIQILLAKGAIAWARQTV